MSNTFFKPTGASGQDAQEFTKSAFKDISVPSTSNSGWSTSTAKNPLSMFFADDDAPKYSYKLLYISDLILLSDRTKWINNKPTYQVVFNEQCPGVTAYVVGNARLRNLPNSFSIDLRSEGDLFGVTTTGRRVHFFLNPTVTTSQTATVFVDGAANGQTISYGDSAQLSTGANSYYAGVHATSQETRDIHDYRIVTSTAQTLNVCGIGVYFENSTQTVDFYPGSTYLDKTKYTTIAGSGVSLPTLTNYNGAKVLAYKTSTNSYALSAQERDTPISTALGASGFNTVTVATGSGSSFPIGSGVGFRDFGGSLFLGFVTNVSTDTLTISPTLPMGISGNIFKAFNSGTTIAISATLHQMVNTIDFGSAYTQMNNNSFENSQSVLYYQDPYNKYRVFGQSLINSAIDGYRGIYPAVTNSFLQVEGAFQAAEIEYMPFPGVTSVIHATVSVNGIPAAYSMQQGITGPLKQTIFSDGLPGWNMFKLSMGGSFLNTVIRKINLYELASPMGITFGRLAEMDVYGSQIRKTAENATLMTMGVHQRIYADQFYTTGVWSFGVTHSVAGAVYAQGSSTNSVFSISYWGKDFAILGAQSASLTILLNGQATSATLNQMFSVATLGFHSVAVSNRASLCILSAFEFTRPYGEVKNIQNFYPVSEVQNIPTVYSQSDTPLNPKNGDIWGADPKAGQVYVHMWNKWVLINVGAITDDPNVGIGVTSHGGTASDYTTGSGFVNLYNQASWALGTSDTVNGSESTGSDSNFKGVHLVVDYNNTSQALVNSARQFNRASWSTFTARATGKTWGANTQFRSKNQFYGNRGVTTGGSAAAAVATADAWNGSAWGSQTAWSNPVSLGSSSEINGVLSVVQGINTSGTAQTLHETRTTVDSIGSATATSNAGNARACANDTSLRASFVIVHTNATSTNTEGLRWNGSSYTTLTTPVSAIGATKCGLANTSQSRAIIAGGQNTTEVYSYNSVSFTMLPNTVANTTSGHPSFL